GPSGATLETERYPGRTVEFLQKNALRLGPATKPEGITPYACGNRIDICGRPLCLKAQSKVLAHVVLHAAAKCPRKECSAIDMTSVRSKIGNSGTEENEWSQAAFAVLEVQ